MVSQVVWELAGIGDSLIESNFPSQTSSKQAKRGGEKQKKQIKIKSLL